MKNGNTLFLGVPQTPKLDLHQTLMSFRDTVSNETGERGAWNGKILPRKKEKNRRYRKKKRKKKQDKRKDSGIPKTGENGCLHWVLRPGGKTQTTGPEGSD